MLNLWTEKAMAPHSSTLAREIPWTGEPGGLQCMGSHRVGHNWSDLASISPSAVQRGFPGDSDGKESVCNAGDPDSMPRSRRSPGERNGYPLQYSCLENFMNRGAWQATVHGFAKSWTQPSNWHFLSLSYLGYWKSCCSKHKGEEILLLVFSFSSDK